jgi:hypothetical protein
MSTDATEHESHSHHSVEVKTTYEDRHAVIAANWDESLHEIKKRSLAALELSAEPAADYRLRFHGHDIVDEGQTLIDLVKDREQRHVDFHVERVLTYYVNGEAETTTSRELKVRAILESAEFTPVTSYTLKSEHPPEDYGTQYDKEVKIHQGQKFQAIFNGPTPTS